MGLLFSRLLHAFGFISDKELRNLEVNEEATEGEKKVVNRMHLARNSIRNRRGVNITDPDEVEQLLIDAKTDIAEAEKALDGVLADKSNPNYKENLEAASKAVGNAYKRPREIMNRTSDQVIQILKERKSKNMSSSSVRSGGKRTLKRVHRPRYSRRAARRV
jgi:predicted S18 family serine protease